MTNEEQKLREIEEGTPEIKRSELWNKIYSIVSQIPRGSVYGDAMDASSASYEIEIMVTALISEKQAEYFEFVKWIGFYNTTLYYRDIDEKWLRTRFDIDGIPTEEYDEYTTEELFEYWKTIEQ